MRGGCVRRSHSIREEEARGHAEPGGVERDAGGDAAGTGVVQGGAERDGGGRGDDDESDLRRPEPVLPGLGPEEADQLR